MLLGPAILHFQLDSYIIERRKIMGIWKMTKSFSRPGKIIEFENKGQNHGKNHGILNPIKTSWNFVLGY